MNFTITKDERPVGSIELDDTDFDPRDLAIVPSLRHVNGEWHISEFILIKRTVIKTEPFEELLKKNVVTKMLTKG